MQHQKEKNKLGCVFLNLKYLSKKYSFPVVIMNFCRCMNKIFQCISYEKKISWFRTVWFAQQDLPFQTKAEPLPNTYIWRYLPGFQSYFMLQKETLLYPLFTESCKKFFIFAFNMLITKFLTSNSWALYESLFENLKKPIILKSL